MRIVTHSFFFAEYYNCGIYGGGSYQTGTCASPTTQNSNNPLDSLANTGYDILIPLFLALSLLAAGLLLLIRRYMRKRKQQARTF